MATSSFACALACLVHTKSCSSGSPKLQPFEESDCVQITWRALFVGLCLGALFSIVTMKVSISHGATCLVLCKGTDLESN